MKVERVVCDTNVLISAAIMPDGTAGSVVKLVARKRWLLMSLEILNELTSRLSRGKFDRYLDDDDREAFAEFLRWTSEKTDIRGIVLGVRDPDDDKILETANVGRADCLITSDKDLLALRPIGEHAVAGTVDDALYQGIAIVTPVEFLALVDQTGS